jgi:hypothetical protein
VTRACTAMIVASAVLFAGPAARADILHFAAFENDGNANLEGLQLSMELIAGHSTVDFLFRNTSTIPAVVTSIYIEATTGAAAMLLGGDIVSPQPPGVLFGIGTSPTKPPGSIRHHGGLWQGTLLSAGALAPSPHNGIGPDESLTIRFELGSSHAALVQALSTSPTEFRIIQHVQGLQPNDESIWTMNQPIPAPGSVALALGMLGLAARRRRGVHT